MIDEVEDANEEANQKDLYQPGTLYFMQETDYLSGEKFDYYKIGIVRGDGEVLKREKQHRTGNPRLIDSVRELKLPAVQRLETYLHNKFANYRVSSGEWFYLPGSRLEEVIQEAESQRLVIESAIFNLLENSAAPKQVHDQTPLSKSATLEALVTEFLIAKQVENSLDSKRKKVAQALIELSGNQSEFDFLFQKSTSRATSRLDGAALKKARKDLYESYLTVESSSWSLKFLVDAPEFHENSTVVITESPLELHQDYLNFWSRCEEASWRALLLKSKLVSKVGLASGIEGLLEWKQVKKRSFDKSTFEKEHPSIYKDFIKAVPAKNSIKVAEWASYQAKI